jgi:uncharacterized protein YjbI with pentapeptide repeats
MAPQCSNSTESRRWRFTIRDVLLAMVILALALGWHRSSRDANARLRQMEQRMLGLRMQAGYDEDRADFAADAEERTSKGSVLHAVDLKGSVLRGVSISMPQENAFQLTVFSGCDLSKASLIAGTSSFQVARFDDAKLNQATLKGDSAAFQHASFQRADLSEAKLTGGGGAFQAATFAEANLSGAVLKGGDGSFQMASFAGANLSGARLVGGDASFGGMDIDGAQFLGTDLSGLDADDLGTCHFDTPPTYDDATRFPAGFDPALAGWKRAVASE